MQYLPRSCGCRRPYPVHLRARDPDRQRVQRIMLAAPRPEPVREPEEIFLVDRVQDLDHRSLNDLVLQRGDAQRPLAVHPVSGMYRRRDGSAR